MDICGTFGGGLGFIWDEGMEGGREGKVSDMGGEGRGEGGKGREGKGLRHVFFLGGVWKDKIWPRVGICGGDRDDGAIIVRV